ncbi:MAG: hypothetical protein RBR02_06385 [Desulfuromonadaceae bacterium]|nr:hypothetical protein [Desulfuromonadaceae bacterium]
MLEREQETIKEVSRESVNKKRIDELKHWLRYEYSYMLLTLERHRDLGINPIYSKRELQLEAHKKEQELRMLEGKQPLSDPKIAKII